MLEVRRAEFVRKYFFYINEKAQSATLNLNAMALYITTVYNYV